MAKGMTKQKHEKLDTALDNIEWARDAALDGELLKANSHLYRAEELIEEHKESIQ